MSRTHGLAWTMPGAGRRHYIVWNRGAAGFYLGGQLLGCNLSLHLNRQRWVLELWDASQRRHILLQWHARETVL